MRGRICGTGSYLPEKYYDNNDIAKIVETSDAWIRERTGIVRRHIASGYETTVSMAVEAGRRALENGHVLPEEVDMILVSTITPNAVIPGVAFQVQAALGADRAVCFDLSAACSGFVFAYQTAQAYIAAGLYQTILLIGSETLSAINNWEDRSSCILFGDGAGSHNHFSPTCLNFRKFLSETDPYITAVTSLKDSPHRSHHDPEGFRPGYT